MLIKYPLIPQPIVGSGKILLCVKITAHFYIRIFFFNSVFVGGCFPPQMYIEIAVCLLWLHEYSCLLHTYTEKLLFLPEN